MSSFYWVLRIPRVQEEVEKPTQSPYYYCLSWSPKGDAATYSAVGCLSTRLRCRRDFYIWSLIIVEVAGLSHRKQSDKRVSKVGAGAVALAVHSCHWHTVGRQLKRAYVALLHTKWNHCTLSFLRRHQTPRPTPCSLCAGATAWGSSAPGKVASHRGDERQRLTATIIRFSLGKSGRGQGTKIKLCEVRHCKKWQTTQTSMSGKSE